MLKTARLNIATKLYLLNLINKLLISTLKCYEKNNIVLKKPNQPFVKQKTNYIFNTQLKQL